VENNVASKTDARQRLWNKKLYNIHY
jgi:hypothetical protein